MAFDLEKPRVICRCCLRETLACVECGRLILYEGRRDTERRVVCMYCRPDVWGIAEDPWSEEEA